MKLHVCCILNYFGGMKYVPLSYRKPRPNHHHRHTLIPTHRGGMHPPTRKFYENVHTMS